MKVISKSLLVRAIAYGLAMAYLTLDLFVLHGPLRQRIARHANAKLEKQTRGPGAVAARIFGQDITMREVDQAMMVAAFRSGRPLAGDVMDPAKLFDRRVLALTGLLDAHAIDAKLTVRQDLTNDTDLDKLIADEETRVGGPADLDARLAVAGMTRESYRAHHRAEAARTRYLEERIEASGANAVDDSAVQAWLDAHKEEMILPARIKLRHIFKATLHKDPEDVRQQMVAIHGQLSAGTQAFASIAAVESDDASNNNAGGLLGWVEGPDARLPDGLDFAALLAAPIGKPLPPMRTVLGWHIFQIDEVAAPTAVDAAAAENDVRAMLRTTQRRDVVPRILDALKREGDARVFTSTLRTTPFSIE